MAKSQTRHARSNIRQKGHEAEGEWASLRLRDRIRPGVRVLFVGINPGVRSAITGHHFAGYSNRFWKLLRDARLVPEPITYLDDDRFAEWGYGITNLVARASPGIDALRPAEYAAGWRTLERKVRRYKPELVAFIGITLYRVICPLVGVDGGVGETSARRRRAAPSPIGLQPLTLHGARVFVLPNPSGRNANFSYGEMLAAFRKLARYLRVSNRHHAAAASAARSKAASS